MKTKSNRKTREARELSDNCTLSPRKDWSRTISASDLKRYLQCPAMYLLRHEHEDEEGMTVSEQIGEIVHAESIKPVAERSTNVIAMVTTVSEPKAREQAANEAQAMITVSAAAQERDSQGAVASAKERVIRWFDSYTNTTWCAKPDSMDLKDDGRPYLQVVDQKAGRYRSRQHMVGAFFFAYVAKQSQALGHTGPVRYVLRYLRDWAGNVLKKPDERDGWIGRRLNQEQDMMLYGIQATIKVIDRDWERGEFDARCGGQCEKCPFAKSRACPAGAAWLDEQRAQEDEEEAAVLPVVAVATAAVSAQDQVAAAMSLRETLSHGAANDAISTQAQPGNENVIPQRQDRALTALAC